MDIEELKTRIRKYGEDRFEELIRNEGYEEESKDGEEIEGQSFSEVVGCDFEFLASERSKQGSHDDYFWRFKVDGKVYQIEGFYSSWDSPTMDDVMDFAEVRQIEKKIKVWEYI